MAGSTRRAALSPPAAVLVLAAGWLLASSARAQTPPPVPPAPPIPGTPTPTPSPPTEPPPSAPADQAPPAGATPAEGQTQEPSQPPPVALPRVRLYGDHGTPEIAVGLGYSSTAGFLAAGGFRYFVLDGLAPGIEATYVHGGTNNTAYGLVLASLRVVPLRTPGVALALTGRTGRVLLAQHPDGWGAGGEAAVIIGIGAGAALELGYEFLRLLPGSFCADLSTCVLQGPVIGLRFGW